MIVANQFQRTKCLTAGNVVSKDEKVQGMTVKDLKATFAIGEKDEEAQKIINSLKYFSQNLPGSNQYFYQKMCHTQVLFKCLLGRHCATTNLLLQAFMNHLRVRSNDKQMFNIFKTFSMADLHWDELHR